MIEQLSIKQQTIFKRRVKIIELKYIKHYRNIDIASSLNVDKATITRDVSYISKNSQKLLDELTVYVYYFNQIIHDDDYKRQRTYNDLQEEIKWLASASNVIESWSYKD